MSVVVDDETLETGVLGLTTVGEVLDHVRRNDRLVVQLLIDGEAPDLTHMSSVQAQSLDDRTLYIETADPREIALAAVKTAREMLESADRMRLEIAELLRNNNWTEAMTKLGECLVAWQQIRQTVGKVAQLRKLKIEDLGVGKATRDTVANFAEQLRGIKTAVETGDIVSLTDILTYEFEPNTVQWRVILDALAAAI